MEEASESDWSVFISLWQREREVSSSSAVSSLQADAPPLKKLDDMVYEVHRPADLESTELEVVFFHGLQLKHHTETYFRTWMERDSSQLWLQTLLVDQFPRARILIVSYDSSAKKTSTEGRMDIQIIAENLVGSLTSDMVNVGQSGRPVVLVGHCLGGLVMKELCLKLGELSEVEQVDNLEACLRGMFFFGTPHSGSVIVDQLHKYVRVEGPLLEEMKILRDSCARRNENFQRLRTRHRWLTCGVGESKKTFLDFMGKSIHVVPEASARPYMDSYFTDSEADHYNVCKPSGSHSSSFQLLTSFLRQIRDAEVRRVGVVKYAKQGREYVVDMEGRAKQVCQMLEKSHTVFINGVSGIGKTTLAEQVCNLMSRNFKFVRFISLEDSDGREQLRRKLRESLEEVDIRLKYKSWEVIEYLKGRKARVLLVLDNVKSKDQLKLFDRDEWSWPGEGSNSRLLVTTTNALLCTASTYKVPYLSDRESRDLFLHYTFKSTTIEPTYLIPVVEQVIRQCDKFPLTLKALGSFISREGDVQDYQFWLDIANRHSRAEEVAFGNDPEYKLLASLRPTYDDLGPDEREILLDAATLFHGRPFSLVEVIWKASRPTAKLAWTNLRNASLVSLDSGGRIWIQEQVRSFCKSIACPRGGEVYKWTRITEQPDAKELLACTESQGSVSTEALRLEAMHKERIKLRCGTFSRYSQLKYLMLNGVEVTGSTHDLESWKLELPISLVYLSWSGGLFETCPVDFSRLDSLVALELRDCRNMTTLPPSLLIPMRNVLVPLHPSLKWLDLDGCRSLTELPDDFSILRLQYLGLKNTGLQLNNVYCNGVVLRYLQASGTLLSAFPLWMREMKSFVSIDLSGTNVKELPASIGSLRRLTSLKLDGTNLTSLPESIGERTSRGGLTELKALHLMETEVTNLPRQFGQLHALEYLSLKDTPLKELPESFVQLRSLKHLQLMGTNILQLPFNFGALKNLEYLDLSNTGVTELPDSFSKLSRLNTFLKAHDDPERRSRMPITSLQPLSSLPNLQVLSLSTDCFVISGSKSAIVAESLHSFFPRLSTVQSLSFHDNCNLEFLPPLLFRALKQMPSLRSLLLKNFHGVVSLPDEIGGLSQLEALQLVEWEKLEELPESMGGLPLLIRLELQNLPSFRRLPESLGTLALLSDLAILQCGRLLNLPLSFGHSNAQNGGLEGGSRESEAVDENIPLIISRKLRNLVKMYTDSWDILHCSLECCQDKIVDGVFYSLNCREMNDLSDMPLSADHVAFPIWVYNKDSVDRLGQIYMQRRRQAHLPMDVLHRPCIRPLDDAGGDDDDDDELSYSLLFDYQRLRIHIGCHSRQDGSVDWKLECPDHPSFDVLEFER